ncbi:MAG: hypothetical protein H6673_09785 [Anaerolineales bacterium]|nr:hypothetical protein [Anaerolineales bacterium]
MTNPIPSFKTLQQEAEFWDTHDTTDFEAEMQPTQVSYKPQIKRGVTVRFPSTDLMRLQTIAHRQGIGVTTLVRMIALEFLNKQSPQRLA